MTGLSIGNSLPDLADHEDKHVRCCVRRARDILEVLLGHLFLLREAQRPHPRIRNALSMVRLKTMQVKHLGYNTQQV
jgi:hypothetical protein